MISVIKRSGETEPLDITKIQKYTKTAVNGLENVSQSELEVDAHIQFNKNLETKDIQNILTKTAVAKIDIDRPQWTFVASKLFVHNLYHVVGKTLDGVKGANYVHLKRYLNYGEDNGKIFKGLKDNYLLEKLNVEIDPRRDSQFTYLGMKTLYDRYLLKDKNGKPFELPQHMFMGIAMFLSIRETNPESLPKDSLEYKIIKHLNGEDTGLSYVHYNIYKKEDIPKIVRTYWATKLYHMISTFKVMLATPTLSNARTTRHQLSSCYIGVTPDNIEGIFDSYKEMALLSKFGGGIGWDWNLVRGIGSSIDNNQGAAGGTIPFLKITNDIAVAVDQLGTRKGAIAIYLQPWHIDINDFLDLKKNSGEERRRAHDLFPALWINDEFMKRASANETWTLFNPHDVEELNDIHGEEFTKRYKELEEDDSIPKERVNAKILWKRILTSYFETGTPFLTFKDEANRRNPNSHEGMIRSSNLCVSGDTRMATQFGLKKAKDLYKSKNKLTATYDNRVNGELDNKGVSTAQCIEMLKTATNVDVFKIETKDGYEIKSTEWHKYYIKRNNSIIKIPMKDIIISDEVLIQSGEGQFGQSGYEELGFLMGLIAGDGTFSYKKDKEHWVSHIDLYNDEINLNHMVKDYQEKIIKKEYKSLLNPLKSDFINKMPKIIQHTKNSKKQRFSSVRLGRILNEKYNFNGNTKLEVPELIYESNKQTMSAYLQGLFIADGTVNIIKNGKHKTFGVQLASIEKNFLKEIQLLLSNYGIRSKISHMKRKNTFKYTTVKCINKEYHSKPIYRLTLNGDNAIEFINKIGFIGKKQEKALGIMLEREKQGLPKYGRKKEKFFAKIKEITYIGKEDVYDTTQLENHSLIFNGIVTGNCTEIFQNTSPNTYKVKIKFVDGEILYFEEEEEVLLDNGVTKQANKITSIDSLNGKEIYFVDKEVVNGRTAVCNLASINLSKVNTKKELEEIIPIAIRTLDNVIDLNFYPLEKVKETNLLSRAIGLGVMGEAQMLAEAGIHWGSQEHFDKIDEIMEIVSYNAILASHNLSKEKGSYDTFEGSSWSKGILPIHTANEEASKLTSREFIYDWEELGEKVETGIRNGYLMAIAPTSSISILVGTTQAIEPIYKRKWFEENLSGLIPVVAPNLNVDNYQYYTPAYDIDQILIIKAGAIRQKWIDQGQSLNIFLTLDKASGKVLNEIYMLAWKLGLKSTYYLRTESPTTNADKNIADRSMECAGCQ